MAGEGAVTEELVHWVTWRLPLPRLIQLLHARARSAGLITVRKGEGCAGLAERVMGQRAAGPNGSAPAPPANDRFQW
jgi:hypothetical protein